MRTVFLLFTGMIILLMTAYLGVSVYFCSGALKGDLAGCAVMAGGDMVRSTTAQIAALCCAVGAYLGLRDRAKR